MPTYTFFGFWSLIVASGWVAWPAAGWMSALLCTYVLACAAVLHDPVRVVVTALVVTAVLAAVVCSARRRPPIWVAIAAGGVAISIAFHKRYLDRRLSNTLRHNVIIRSQAQGAREAERQRIAADFHDGPLQSFISFQMRLEIVKKLLARDVDAATEELLQLQQLCKSQVGDLRSFVRRRTSVRRTASAFHSAAWWTSSSAIPASPASTFSKQRIVRPG